MLTFTDEKEPPPSQLHNGMCIAVVVSWFSLSTCGTCLATVLVTPAVVLYALVCATVFLSSPLAVRPMSDHCSVKFAVGDALQSLIISQMDTPAVKAVVSVCTSVQARWLPAYEIVQLVHTERQISW